MRHRIQEETVERVYEADPDESALCLVVAREGAKPFAVLLKAHGGALSVGRDQQADVRIPSPSLSRLHLAIELRRAEGGEIVTVRDLGSRNGTLLDGSRVGDAPTAFTVGSTVTAGDTRLSLLRRGALANIPLLFLGATAEAAPPSQESDADVPASFRYPSLRAIHRDLRRIAPRPISVLARGETGTGKELLAREIHRLSGRPGMLVAVNAAALPETLIESELFGHERGAFSGAQVAKVGLVEAADRGTLFLDEIGELPLAMQGKLLRVLEEQAVRRVGANVEKKVDLRVVAATHQDLEALAEQKRFRHDLLFRINGATIVLPPLRARRGEIGALASHLLAELAAPAPPTIDPAALALLDAYEWPGNVRELKHVLERALAFADGGVITPEQLPPQIASRVPSDAGRGASAPGSGPVSGTVSGPPSSVRTSVRDFERDRIIAALQEAGGNRARAAELLGLPRRTLAYKISKMRIDES